MSHMDVFNQDAFNSISLSASINHVPFLPTRIRELGIFEEIPSSNISQSFEEKNGQLALVSAQPRGAPKQQLVPEKRKLISLSNIHLPEESYVRADEIQGVRAFGSENDLMGLEQVVQGRLNQMSRDLDATIEHLRMGALKGQVLDADGATVLYDLFSTFGISQYSEIDFDLDNSNPDPGAVKKKCHDVTRKTQDALGAAMFTRVHAFCGPTFMDDLVSHPETREAYARWQDGEALRQSQARTTFFYAGILFEEYRGSVNGTDFVADTKAHFFPVGVPGLFIQPNAPADWVETVNTPGLPKYAKVGKAGQYDEYVPVTAQANPLPVCTKPKCLIKAKNT